MPCADLYFTAKRSVQMRRTTEPISAAKRYLETQRAGLTDQLWDGFPMVDDGRRAAVEVLDGDP